MKTSKQSKLLFVKNPHFGAVKGVGEETIIGIRGDSGYVDRHYLAYMAALHISQGLIPAGGEMVAECLANKKKGEDGELTTIYVWKTPFGQFPVLLDSLGTEFYLDDIKERISALGFRYTDFVTIRKDAKQ